MRFIQPAELDGLRRVAPFTWESMADQSAFIFDLSDEPLPFICFFLKAEVAHAAPSLAFDAGDGFDELGAAAFGAFPFGFYHVSLAKVGPARRMRLRACKGRTTFRCIVLRTARPIPVAVLHFLFNLRYRNIGLIAPPAGGPRGRWAWLKSNVARIRTFFTTVSTGNALRVQLADDDVLVRLRRSQTLLARPIQAEMAARFATCDRPLLSFVVPVFNARSDHLRDLIASFTGQVNAVAELILVDDASTERDTRVALGEVGAIANARLIERSVNGGIAAATNEGIAAARGRWVTFVDHDDVIAEGAIAVIAAAILDNPDASFFYTDEIIADAALRLTGSFCKPAYDPVLLSGLNYINHFSVFRSAEIARIGGLRSDCDGSQDYDLLLRYLADVGDDAVVHIPFLAYIWRRAETTYSAIHRERSVTNARGALQRAYANAHGPVTIEAATNPDLHRVRFKEAARPSVSVIIPNRDSPGLIARVVADVQTRTAYPVDIVVADNGTTDADVLRFYQARSGDGFRIDLHPEPFNFARMSNRGARLARGDAFLFLNNDIEVLSPDWLSEMVECLTFPQTGIVGARLLYPNGTLQHAGVIAGLGEAAGHWYVGDAADEPGPMGRLAVRQTMSAVTAACMLVTRRCFEAVGGFDETAFPIAYNDVDFCLRARALGFRTVWTPFATLCHHESVSRGSDAHGENNLRFRAEMDRLQARHGTTTLIDPAYSPFYDRRYSRPHLTVPPNIPPARAGQLAPARGRLCPEQ